MEEPVADVEGFKKYLVELARENEALAAKVQTLEGRLAEERASATDRKRKIKGYVAQLDAEKVQLEQTVASLRDKVYHAEHEAQSTAADLAKTREDLVKAKAEGARRVPKTAPAIVAAFDEGAFDADGGARPASPVKRKKKKAPSSPTSGMRLVKMGDFEGDDSDDDDDLSKAANLCRSFCAAQRAEMEALKGQVVKLVDLHRRSAALAVSVSQKKGVEHAEAAAASTAAYEARLYLGGLNVANQVQSLKAFCAAERGGLEALRAAVRSLGDSNRDAAAAAVALAQQQDARHRDEAVAAEAARDARESVLREAADAARDERAREAALGAEAAREAEAREGHLREAVATAEAARVAEVAEAKRLADMMTLEAAIEAAHLLDVAQLDSNRLADLADLKASFEAKRVADAETLEAARLADVATEVLRLAEVATLEASFQAKRLADATALQASFEAKRVADGAALEAAHRADIARLEALRLADVAEASIEAARAAEALRSAQNDLEAETAEARDAAREASDTLAADATAAEAARGARAHLDGRCGDAGTVAALASSAALAARWEAEASVERVLRLDCETASKDRVSTLEREVETHVNTLIQVKLQLAELDTVCASSKARRNAAIDACDFLLQDVSAQSRFIAKTRLIAKTRIGAAGAEAA